MFKNTYNQSRQDSFHHTHPVHGGGSKDEHRAKSPPKSKFSMQSITKLGWHRESFDEKNKENS